MAVFRQSFCIRLRVATGRDLAQTCHSYYSRRVSFWLWVLCEIAIVACNLAELLGSAIALELLFNIPLAWENELHLRKIAQAKLQALNTELEERVLERTAQLSQDNE